MLARDSRACEGAACLTVPIWAQVHGVDFYAGDELADPAAFELRLERARMRRAPRPEEGEQPDQAAGARMLMPDLRHLRARHAGRQAAPC